MYATMLPMPEHRTAPGAPPVPLAPAAPAAPLVKPIVSALHNTHGKPDDITVCERCGAEMYRMHAVWRCPACRFKTDCCGW